MNDMTSVAPPVDGEEKDGEENYSGSDTIQTILSGLSVTQIRFVAARLNAKNDKEAAAAIDISPATVYSWSKKEKGLIVQAQRLYLQEAVSYARAYLARHVLEAAIIKVQALQGKPEAKDKFRQDAATEILDRMLGKPKQSVDVSSDSDALVPKTYVSISPDMWDEAG